MRLGWIAVGLALLIAGAATASDSRPTACPTAGGASVVARAHLPGRPGFLLLQGNDLWVAIAARTASGRGALARVDSRSGRVDRVFRLPIDPYQLAVGFGSLWLTGATNDTRYRAVLRVDPRTGRIVRLPGVGPSSRSSAPGARSGRSGGGASCVSPPPAACSSGVRSTAPAGRWP